MSYASTDTGQIREAGDRDSETTLRYHELVLGVPLCGQRVHPWHGNDMVLVETGAHEVDCGRCAQSRWIGSAK